MCEYCEGISNPISFPQTFTFDNGKEQVLQHGFKINLENEKIEFFESYDNSKENRITLFSREIDYCPFCGIKLSKIKKIVQKQNKRQQIENDLWNHEKKKNKIWKDFWKM